ncbi:MAG: alpha/beta hydrolase [Burkholderiaceae bacterium]
MRKILGISLAAVGLLVGGCAGPVKPDGVVNGTAWRHTDKSSIAVIQNAWVAIPSQATGGPVYSGPFKHATGAATTRVPVVVVLHGSSGITPALREWQKWLASELGIASIAPDSMQLPGRLTYKSPVEKDNYERIHELRAVEIVFALQALRATAWADSSRLALAGTSEGAVAAARYAGAEFGARLLYSWSCEDNYFVKGHGTALPVGQPVLNAVSARDPFFSSANPWVGNPNPVGNCGPVLRDNPRAEVLLLGNAPHTVLNHPAARALAKRFLVQALQP